MPDTLTALLRRALPQGECNTCSGPHLDREAARLADVVRETIQLADETTRLQEVALEKAQAERDAARRSEEHLRKLLLTEEGERRKVEGQLFAARESVSEAVGLLERLVWVRPADPDRERKVIQDARAYLGRRKEASR